MANWLEKLDRRMAKMVQELDNRNALFQTGIASVFPMSEEEEQLAPEYREEIIEADLRAFAEVPAVQKCA